MKTIVPTKKHDNLFEQIVSEENFRQAYKKSLERGGKYKAEAIEFARNETDNLNKLRQSLVDETYAFSGYIRFILMGVKPLWL
jgi:hypothetical protein